jgi:hypothetical protein
MSEGPADLTPLQRWQAATGEPDPVALAWADRLWDELEAEQAAADRAS